MDGSVLPADAITSARFRSLDDSSDSQTSLLIHMQKAMDSYEIQSSDGDTLAPDCNDSFLLPTSQEVNKIGRPAKEPCYSPWLKIKNKNKTRAEQMRSKVTTGKYLYEFEKRKEDEEDEDEKDTVEEGEVKEYGSEVVKEERLLDAKVKTAIKGKRRRNVADAFLSISEALEDQRKAKRTKHKQDQDRISKDIPDNAYKSIIDVKSDGFCGFCALATQIFDDENEFLEVKYAMRDQLLSNFDLYCQAFGNSYDFNACKNIICFGIEEKVGSKKVMMDANTIVSRNNWFMAPDCAQIAACTFGVPVAVYDNDSDHLTFLPVLDRFNSANYKPGPKPLPLLMHFVNRNHWITLELKRSIKIVWPAINRLHYQAMANLKKKENVKSFWNYHLTFKKHK
ncbi:hypothetical protein BD560DRAFT_437686 [Blakeslea trispora]|nr:hypothetical protein BD560DRAFT_437686 [Blakeslea trispora]